VNGQFCVFCLCTSYCSLFLISSKLHVIQCCHFSLFKTKSGLFFNRLVYFFAIWFIVYCFGLFLVFLKMFHAKYQLCSLQWYMSGFGVLRKIWHAFGSLLFLATVCSNIVVPTRTSTLHPLTCHVPGFSGSPSSL